MCAAVNAEPAGCNNCNTTCAASTTFDCIHNLPCCCLWQLPLPLLLPLCRCPPWRHTDWVVTPQHSIAVNNMACSPTLVAHGFTVGNTTNTFCKVCGGTSAVAAACLKDKHCVAFVVDENDSSCGVLKSSAAKTEQFMDESKTVYCYTPRAPTCKGRWGLFSGVTAHAARQVSPHQRGGDFFAAARCWTQGRLACSHSCC